MELIKLIHDFGTHLCVCKILVDYLVLQDTNYSSYISKDLLAIMRDKIIQIHSVYSYEYTMVLERNKRKLNVLVCILYKIVKQKSDTYCVAFLFHLTLPSLSFTRERNVVALYYKFILNILSITLYISM